MVQEDKLARCYQVVGISIVHGDVHPLDYKDSTAVGYRFTEVSGMWKSNCMTLKDEKEERSSIDRWHQRVQLSNSSALCRFAGPCSTSTPKLLGYLRFFPWLGSSWFSLLSDLRGGGLELFLPLVLGN